jgi:hypothetical protein
LARDSESSETSELSPSADLLSEDASVGSAFAEVFFAPFGALFGAFSSGAAWKIGTGIAGAFFFDLASVASATGASITSGEFSPGTDFFLPIFFTARLRGDIGSIAMAPNPLCVN